MTCAVLLTVGLGFFAFMAYRRLYPVLGSPFCYGVAVAELPVGIEMDAYAKEAEEILRQSRQVHEFFIYRGTGDFHIHGGGRVPLHKFLGASRYKGDGYSSNGVNYFVCCICKEVSNDFSY